MSNSGPKIRFLEFNEDWEEILLKDIISAVGGATPSKSNPDYWNGPIVWLSSQEIKEKYVSKGTYTITHKAVDSKATRMVEKGTPLIVSRSGILARLFPISIPTKNVAINQDIKALLYDKKIIDTNYLVAQIQSKENFILNSIIKTGTTVQSINMPDFYKLKLTFPSKDEQDKIGSLFECLDDTIANNQKKLEKLIQFKQAMLQKMFPKEGETVPEVRFEGFKDNWRLYNFYEVANVLTGLTYSPKNIVDKDNPNAVRVLRSSNIKNNRFILSDDDVFVHKNYINISFLKNNQILMTASNGSLKLVGKNALIENTNSKSLVHGGFMYVIDSEINLFLNAWLLTDNFRSRLVHVQGGDGSIANLKRDLINETSIMVPEYKEQRLIGEYFYKLDQLIDNKQTELNKLKQFKQAMLDKMFV